MVSMGPQVSGESRGVREKLNRNPSLAVGLAAACAVLVGAWSLWSLFASGDGVSDSRQYSNDAFYTTDDGATYFRDSGDRLSPFMKDGKPAYRAHVFTCDRGKTRFVGYLERLSDEGRSRLLTLNNDPKAPADHAVRNAIMLSATEVKKPRQAASAWVPQRRKAEAQVAMSVECPDGQGYLPEPVMP